MIDRRARDPLVEGVVLLCVAVALVRMLDVPGPLSDNDVSRWLTIRALVEHGTFAIGRRTTQVDGSYLDTGLMVERGWHTADVVLDPETATFYSSKPPLLAAVASVPVFALQLLGVDVVRAPAGVVRTVLVLVNGAGLVAFLLSVVGVARTFAGGRSSELFVVALAAGAFSSVQTFITVLNNHVPAAGAAALALWLVVAPLSGGSARGQSLGPRRAFAGGACAGLAAALELPALALVAALVGVVLLLRGPRVAMAIAAGALLPVAAAAAVTAAALGTPWPPWLGGATEWYRFAGSYWSSPIGIDVGERSAWRYAFHLLIGHHGLFSLTPFLLFGAAGAALVLWRRTSIAPARRRSTPVVFGALAVALAAAIAGDFAIFPICVACGAAVLLVPAWWRKPTGSGEPLARITVALLVTVVPFYVDSSSSYGGITSFPRWFMWLTPALYMLAPLGLARTPRGVVGVAVTALALALSAVSAWTPGVNPFVHPWLLGERPAAVSSIVPVPE